MLQRCPITYILPQGLLVRKRSKKWPTTKIETVSSLSNNYNYEGRFTLTFPTVLGLCVCYSYMFSSLQMAIYCTETAFKEDLLVRILGLLYR